MGMPNWLQLLEHTAEFSPGPWVVGERDTTGSQDVPLYAPGAGHPRYMVGEVMNSEAGKWIAGDRGEEWSDPEQGANARLMADAPDMLRLLAEMAVILAHAHQTRGTVTTAEGLWYANATELLRRHVRIGCAPVDAESGHQPPAVQLGNDVGEYQPREQRSLFDDE